MYTLQVVLQCLQSSRTATPVPHPSQCHLSIECWQLWKEGKWKRGEGQDGQYTVYVKLCLLNERKSDRRSRENKRLTWWRGVCEMERKVKGLVASLQNMTT